MHRKLLVLIIACLLLAACGSETDTAPAAQEQESAGSASDTIQEETAVSTPTTMPNSTATSTGTEPAAATPAADVTTGATAVAEPTTPPVPTATRPMRSFALDAANLLNLIDLSQPQTRLTMRPANLRPETFTPFSPGTAILKWTTMIWPERHPVFTV